ncbi:DUF418 domain-containing protein [Mammaliicoccus vitulinus]|uniref:DUF418 domain-containing protein n=1 Tax=Mammaliicoccus vitulinus TaxID=71237 RepID=UPI000D1D3B7D|nr:DUF418 domain-containing protein [Mammaliicoccus vitulinus]PTI90507.1 DUF418 domain-containing protein [Mammaliicoccus vitulinus]
MKRIEVVDALRGFSLFGIFMANLLIFQFGLTGHLYIEHYHLDAINKGIYHFIKILFEGSFMPIFAILFGFSLDKLYQSMKTKQVKHPRVKLLRRALFLMLIGSLHAYFIWEGDILFGYAISMLVVIPFISLKSRFFKWVTIIGFVFILAISIISLFDSSEPFLNEGDKATYIHEIKSMFSEGSYWDIRNVDEQIEDPMLLEMKNELGDAMGWFFIFIIFMEVPYFTLGICLSRYKWFEKSIKETRFSKLFIYLIPVSLVGKSSYLWISNENISESLATTFGIVLAIGFICLFKYLYETYQDNIIFRGFENLGKMSLSMYMMQSVIGTLILYSYGLGLFGKNILVLTFLSFVLIYILQMVLASWYQKYLRYGPLEYLLRMFTYWKIKIAKGR